MKFEVQYFNADTQSIHRKVFPTHRLATAIGKRLAIAGCRKVIIRRRRELEFNVWLIDSITEKMILIERLVDEDQAIASWREWNDNPRDSIFVMVPDSVRMPMRLMVAG